MMDSELTYTIKARHTTVSMLDDVRDLAVKHGCMCYKDYDFCEAAIVDHIAREAVREAADACGVEYGADSLYHGSEEAELAFLHKLGLVSEYEMRQRLEASDCSQVKEENQPDYD